MGTTARAVRAGQRGSPARANLRPHSQHASHKCNVAPVALYFLLLPAAGPRCLVTVAAPAVVRRTRDPASGRASLGSGTGASGSRRRLLPAVGCCCCSSGGGGTAASTRGCSDEEAEDEGVDSVVARVASTGLHATPGAAVFATPAP